MPDKKRDSKIDNIRAFAILTVVLGHSIILYSSSWDLYHPGHSSILLDFVKRFINLYQMPLFFSLSGYLFARQSCIGPALGFWGRKAKRILLPFLAIGLCWMIPIKFAVHYPGYLGCSFFGAARKLMNGSDTGHLWYLPTLFYFFAVAIFVAKLCGNRLSTWAVASALGVFAAFFTQRIPGNSVIIVYLRFVINYFWSFALGASLYFEMAKLKKRGSAAKAWNSICAAMAACCAFAAVFVEERLSLLASILIVIAMYMIVPQKENTIVGSISQNSFGLYLFHSPLIYITFSFALNYPPVAVVAINFFVWGTAAFLLTSAVRKTPLKVLIGE